MDKPGGDLAPGSLKKVSMGHREKESEHRRSRWALQSLLHWLVRVAFPV